MYIFPSFHEISSISKDVFLKTKFNWLDFHDAQDSFIVTCLHGQFLHLLCVLRLFPVLYYVPSLDRLESRNRINPLELCRCLLH